MSVSCGSPPGTELLGCLSASDTCNQPVVGCNCSLQGLALDVVLGSKRMNLAELTAGDFHRTNKAGNTSSTATIADAVPPTIGAAMRFITSAPVPSLTRMGISKIDNASPVISMGRVRWAAPMATFVFIVGRFVAIATINVLIASLSFSLSLCLWLWLR